MGARIRSPLGECDHQLLPPRISEPEDVPFHQRNGLKRKVSLRDGFLRKLKNEGTRVSWNRNGKIKRQRPLKKVSRSLRERLKVYQFLAKIFLSKPENENCIICTVRREHGENIVINRSTEIHHHRRRRGRLLCWVPGFRASCYPCRLWPHENGERARELGLLASAVLFDVFPD